MPTTKIHNAKSDDRYIVLTREFPLRPIRSLKMNERACTVLRSLFNQRDRAANDYKTVLISLIVTYEREARLRMANSKATAADIVRFLLEENSMSINALAKELGIARSALSAMLNGHRGWSKSAIIAVTDRFKLKPDIFLRQTPTKVRI